VKKEGLQDPDCPDAEGQFMDESSKSYGKSLKKIANDKKLKMISKKDRDTLKRLADLMKNEESVDEAAKRDYKDEYKKFQSSPKSKKYRAELNKYNRKKGTYGNGDGKDASHKGGKISGFEAESKNRGRAEKSRLKKEQKLREVIRKIIDEDFAGSYPEHKRKSFDGKRRKQSEVLGYKLTGVDDVKTEIDDATVKEGAGGMGPAKKGKQSHANLRHKTSEKEISVVNSKSVLKKYAKIGFLPYNLKDKYKYGSLKWKAPKMKNGVVVEGKITEKKESAIDVAKRIVKDKQYEQGVDMQTANLIMKIYNAYDKHPALQKKFEKMPLKKMAQNVWRFVK